MLVETFELLVSKWYNIKSFKRTIPCVHCLSDKALSDSPYLFSLEDCERYILFIYLFIFLLSLVLFLFCLLLFFIFFIIIIFITIFFFFFRFTLFISFYKYTFII